LAVRPVQSLSACTVELYLYSPSGCTACTEPQCLYKAILYLTLYVSTTSKGVNHSIWLIIAPLSKWYLHPPIVYIKLHDVIRTELSSTPMWTCISILTPLTSTSKPVLVAARLLRLPVRIPPGARMSVSYECCVLLGRGLCDGLITRPEESYRVCVCVCVSVSVIRCNSNPLHLRRVSRKDQTTKEGPFMWQRKN